VMRSSLTCGAAAGVSNAASLAKQFLLLLVVCVAVLPRGCEGHGYVSNPPSRQAECASGRVTGCGQIQYEPQSVEALKGRTTCNGDIAQWAPLADESKAWIATSVGSSVTFSWTLTAAHATASYEYYIGSVRVGFFSGTSGTSHTVDLSAYPGRRKVLAIWNIGDTANAFYNCVDLQVGTSGGTVTPPTTTTTTTVSTAIRRLSSTAASSTTSSCTYLVVAGDTLYHISIARATTVAVLVAANPAITNPNLIYIGQRLVVPCTTRSASEISEIDSAQGPQFTSTGAVVEGTVEAIMPTATDAINYGDASSGTDEAVATSVPIESAQSSSSTAAADTTSRADAATPALDLTNDAPSMHSSGLVSVICVMATALVLIVA